MVFTNTVSNELNAGPKAPRDILQILKKHFSIRYQLFYCPTNRMEKLREQIRKLYLFYFVIAHSKTLTVVQYPLIHLQKLTQKLGKNGILFIHDLNSIRYGTEDEIQVIASYKYIVAHNEKMKRYLVCQGIEKHKIYTLELFDYLCNEGFPPERTFSPSHVVVVFAGNLIAKKTPFLYQLEEEKMNFTMHLYGVGISQDLHSKILYKGAFLPEDLPNSFDGDFGLVWDGVLDDSDQDEGFKKYTKYNNPHKLSCYIAAGLPVIVWDQSAISDFVLKNNLGYAISSLEEISSLSFSDYEEKKKNVMKFRSRVREGYFTRKVMNEILKKEHFYDSKY